MGVVALCVGCGGSGNGGNAPEDTQSQPDGEGNGDGPGPVTTPSTGTTTSRLRYPANRTQSPISSAIADNLRAIAANDTTRNDDMFMKVGDSITESFAVMSCFAGGSTLDLGANADLQATVTYFASANVSGPSACSEEWCAGAHTGFNRQSYAALGGATADYPLAGTPSPLTSEDDAIAPRIALIEYGTNDSTLVTTAADVNGIQGFQVFYARMQSLVAAMTTRGIVPVLYTVPPYDAPRNGYRNVPTINALIRLVAQSRAVPLIDFNRELLPLPSNGLFDGVHPRVEFGGCVFNDAGLQYGHNVRNLISMRALQRVHDVLEGGAAPDAATTIGGSGTSADPFVIDALPFVDTTTSDATYRLSLDTATRVRLIALQQSGTATLQVDDTTVTSIGHVVLSAGAHTISATGANVGIAVVACESDDPTCQ